MRNLKGSMIVLALSQFPAGTVLAIPNGSCCNPNNLTCYAVPDCDNCPYSSCAEGGTIQCGMLTDCLIDNECVTIVGECAPWFCEGSCVRAEDPAPHPTSPIGPRVGSEGADHPVVFWIGLPL